MFSKFSQCFCVLEDAPDLWCAIVCLQMGFTLMRISSCISLAVDYIILKLCITSSTAQGGGRSFRIGNLYESLVVLNHGWQGESTDGLKKWLELCFLEWLQRVQ